MRRPKLTPDERYLVVALNEMRYRHRDIAQIVNCSPHTLADVIAQDRDRIPYRYYDEIAKCWVEP